ncbi:MAG: 2-(1,2-epoxy-1,2-dihydrophenyl)acetyl-CoA isomerase [Cytophagales bacterium]|nr:2-(1,2-epoxy-1,2-dihydrophenyl)acetyl-CoA isomerase [Cytophagales bacterium]
MPIQQTQKDNLGIITLNRPDVYNSITRELALGLQDALDNYADNPEIRAIMLTGNGKAFCAGQDLQEAVEDNDISITRAVEEHYNPIITRIRSIEKPILAAVNGAAAGAGANIALACDVVVAIESASFIQAFSKIGLVPDSGGTFTLPRLIGFQKASALMMLGDKVSAKDAERMGMIYQVYSDDEFSQKVEELALRLANMPTKGLAYTKHLLNQSMSNGLTEQLEQEKIYQDISANTLDAKEGIQAFLEKRKPKFSGE